MKRIILLIIAMLLMAGSAWATDYYMRADGTAANKAAATGPGSTQTNCMSIATHDGETFSAGDTIYLCDDGGAFRDQIDIPSSGSSGNPITYTEEGGDTPIICGSTVMSSWTDEDGGSDGPIWYGAGAGANVGFILMGTESEANVGTKVSTRLESNILTNGDMESGDPPDNWAATSCSLDGVADVPGGSGGSQSIEITTSAANGRAVHTATSVSESTLYQIEFYYKNTAGDTAQWRIWDISNSTNIVVYTDLADSTSWSSKQTRYFSTSAGTAQINVVFAGKANGDIVYFDDVTLKVSNLDSAREYFIDTGDSNKVYIYANGDTPTNTYGIIEVPQRQWCFNAENKDYITVDGIAGKYSYSAVFRSMDGAYNIFQNCTASYNGGYTISGSVRAGNGFQINGDATYCTIDTCTAEQCFDWGMTCETYDSGSTETMSNIAFTDNTIDQCGGGVGVNTEGGQGSTVSEVTVYRNNITDVGFGWSGIDNSLYGQGLGVKETVSGTPDRVYNVYFEDNIIDGFTYAGIDQYEAGPIYYRRNWITGGTGQKDAVVEDAAIIMNGNDYGNTDNECTAAIEYNIIFDNDCHGINITNNTPDDGADALNAVNIYNNTIYLSHSLTDSRASFYHGGGSNRINFENNIIYASDYYAMETPQTPGFLTSDYNVFLADSSDVILRNVTPRTLVEWQTDLSLDINSLNSDPMFTNPGSDDFTLTDGSPCIDAGVDLGDSYDDALRSSSTWPSGVTTGDQDDPGAAWEIGAYLFFAGGGGGKGLARSGRLGLGLGITMGGGGAGGDRVLWDSGGERMLWENGGDTVTWD